MQGIPPRDLPDGDTLTAVDGRLVPASTIAGAVSGSIAVNTLASATGVGKNIKGSQIADGVTGNVLTIAGTLTAPRTVTLPDAAVTIPAGTLITGTIANANRLDSTSAAGVIKESLIADGISTSVLTIAGTLTAPRTLTLPDASVTIPVGTLLTGTLANANRLDSTSGAGVVKESQIADSVTGSVLTIAGTLTGLRTQTARDASGNLCLDTVNNAFTVAQTIGTDPGGTDLLRVGGAVTAGTTTVGQLTSNPGGALGSEDLTSKKYLHNNAASAEYALLATLPIDGGGSYDFLTVEATIGDWASAIPPVVVTFRNRGGLKFSQQFGTTTNQGKILAYRNADNSASIYIYLAAGFNLGSVRLKNNVQGVIPVYSALTSTAPSGTLVYDSSTAANALGGTAFVFGTDPGGSELLRVGGSTRFAPAATQDAVVLAGRAGGTSSFSNTITTVALTASRIFTLPDVNVTIPSGTLLTGTLANANRLDSTSGAGVVKESLIADGISTSVLTIAGTLTAPRTHTHQDIAGTIPLLEIQPCASFQNKLINPRFEIAQRGTTFTPTLNTETYDLDRFFTKIDGTSVVFTVSQQAHTLGTLINEPAFFRRCAVTTAGTASTVTKILAQRIEGVRPYSNKSLIVTFKAKADAARTVTPNYVQCFGTGGAPSANVTGAGSGIALTTSWATYTQVITLPSISGKTMGTTLGTDYLEVWLSAAANTVQTIDISDIEFKEVAASGQVNTPFEIRPLAVEMALCQRYLPTWNGNGSGNSYMGSGPAASGTSCLINLTLKVTPRTSPTGATVSGTYGLGDSVTNTAATAVSFNAANDSHFTLNVTAASGLTTFRPYYLQINSTGLIYATGCEL